MNVTRQLSIGLVRALPALVALPLAWPVTASAEGAKTLEGTWEITVSIRDCGSGAVIRNVPRMVTFHKGGTLSEFTAAGTQAMPAYRGPGLGTWEYLGDAEFSYSVKFLRLTAFGGADGNIAETRMLQVSKSGDGFAAEGYSTITLGNGVQIPACATEAGARLY